TRFSRDWSSDVCSSDLLNTSSIQLSYLVLNSFTISGFSRATLFFSDGSSLKFTKKKPLASNSSFLASFGLWSNFQSPSLTDHCEIGRASCRERVSMQVC